MKKFSLFANSNKSRTFALTKHRGVEQLVARWAHNPKVCLLYTSLGIDRKTLYNKLKLYGIEL